MSGYRQRMSARLKDLAGQYASAFVIDRQRKYLPGDIYLVGDPCDLVEAGRSASDCQRQNGWACTGYNRSDLCRPQLREYLRKR